MIIELNSNQTKDLSICTDNDAANIAAFKENHLCLFWQPCAASNANLIISETFEKDKIIILLLKI